MGKVINEFWYVWRRDYLLELRQSQRIVKSKGVLPKLNDIVRICNEKLLRQLWKLGQIVELYEPTDSNVQGKTKVGRTKTLIDRPLNRL